MNVFALLEIEPCFLGCLAPSLATIKTVIPTSDDGEGEGKTPLLQCSQTVVKATVTRYDNGSVVYYVIMHGKRTNITYIDE